MMRRFFKNSSILLPVIMVALVSTSFAQNARELEDQQWQLDRERDHLLDQEKQLLRDSDSLGYEIQDLKSRIKELTTKLTIAQSKLERNRHDLITVQMKLIR